MKRSLSQIEATPEALRSPPMRSLVVEDAFVARGPGVLVMPRITAADAPPEKFEVTLRLPSGETRRATATIDVAHIRGALAPYAMLRLHDLSPEDVPRGAEITWDAP